MRLPLIATFGAILGWVPAFGQPIIYEGGFVNGASYASGPTARGAFFALFGENLSVQTTQTSPPYPTKLAGVSVNIAPSSSGPAIPAYLHFVSPGQINGILPSRVPAGQANVTVSVNGKTSAPISILIVNSSFGIFTRDFSGSGPAVLQNFNSPTDTPVNGLANAIHEGQAAILWGSGIGPANGDDNNPQPGNFARSVQLLIGDQLVQPFYAGRSGYPGIDQINFFLPSKLPDGCYIDLAVKIGDTVSNSATIAKATGKNTCEHPFGVSAETLARLDSGGSATIGLFALSSASFQNNSAGHQSFGRTQALDGGFGRFNASQLFTAVANVGLYGYPATNDCIVEHGTINDTPNGVVNSVLEPFNSGVELRLDLNLEAGTRLVVNGADKSASIPKFDAGPPYFTQFLFFETPTPPVPDFLVPGNWTLTGTGGLDIAPFQAQVTIPPLLTVSQPIDFTRNRDVVLSWTGGGSGARDYVFVVGIAAAPKLEDPSTSEWAIFGCTAVARQGTLKIPASITSQLPTTIGSPPGLAALQFLALSGLDTGRFTAPMVSGSTIDAGLILYYDVLQTTLQVN